MQTEASARAMQTKLELWQRKLHQMCFIWKTSKCCLAASPFVFGLFRSSMVLLSPPAFICIVYTYERVMFSAYDVCPMECPFRSVTIVAIINPGWTNRFLFVWVIWNMGHSPTHLCIQWLRTKEGCDGWEIKRSICIGLKCLCCNARSAHSFVSWLMLFYTNPPLD